MAGIRIKIMKKAAWILSFLLAMLSIAGSGRAKTVHLKWDEVKNDQIKDAIQYKLFRTPAGVQILSAIPVYNGPALEYVDNLTSPGTYQYAAVAYAGSTESDLSNIVYSSSMYIDKSGWKIVSADSQETTAQDCKAENAIDGNPKTFWHTQWKDAKPGQPHNIIVDMGKAYKLQSFAMLPRQDGSNHGRIIDFELYVGNDPQAFGDPVAIGSFADDATEKTVALSGQQARYFKLVSLKTSGDGPWTSAAELSIIEQPDEIVPIPPQPNPIETDGSVKIKIAPGEGFCINMDPDGSIEINKSNQ
jgi:F5/8 type C domain